MSKKKSFSGSTMTLKDFHGGSIPSDLPLPSAPGVTVRPPDRPGYDRPIAGRPDHHRSRPGSAGGAAARGLDDRGPPFLPHIGLHFDEDERKPFDAAAAAATLRRPLPEPVRPSLPPATTIPKRPMTSPSVAHHPPATASVPPFHPPSGSSPNAWAVRKEVGGDAPQPAHPTTTVLSGPAATTRLAQASAIEKVSSGRWHSKVHPDVEVIKFHETEGLDRRLNETVRIMDEGDGELERERERERERARARHLPYPDANERNPTGLHFDRSPDHERVRSPVYLEAKARNLAVGFNSDSARDRERVSSQMYPETKERNASSFYHDTTHPASNKERFGGPHLPQQGAMEVSERPKLKLLPRMKPLEPSEMQVLDDKLSYQLPKDPVHIEIVHEMHERPRFIAHEMHESMNVQKPVSAGADALCRAVERPRLNLKPRSLPVEQSDESAEMKRKTVFGGARPRELVLKERGVENIGVNNFDVPSPANRVKSGVLMTDSKLEAAAPATLQVERAENYTLEQRSGRNLERKDYRPNAEKLDVQRTSWRDDNRKNSRDTEKPLETRRQEPDTWRKPVQQPKPHAPAPRFGKAASALELAQAFSKSVSDPKITNQGLPGRTQVPFSRLTDTRDFYSGPARRQINGY